jgi:hypothetical protein
VFAGDQDTVIIEAGQPAPAVELVANTIACDTLLASAQQHGGGVYNALMVEHNVADWANGVTADGVRTFAFGMGPPGADYIAVREQEAKQLFTALMHVDWDADALNDRLARKQVLVTQTCTQCFSGLVVNAPFSEADMLNVELGKPVPKAFNCANCRVALETMPFDGQPTLRHLLQVGKLKASILSPSFLLF